MNRRVVLSFVFMVLCIICSSSLFARQNNVLVLHSYNSGLSWTDDINRGIFESFKEEQDRTIDLRCEFMDTKHFEDNGYFLNYKNFLANKYANTALDIIICVDNPAFNFLASHHNELFAGVPVVFCGINYTDSIPRGFTGVIEDVDLRSNIANITRLHPGYQKLYIINDRSITGSSISKVLNGIILHDFPGLKYEFLTDYSFDELKSKLSTLTKNDLVLMLLFNFDRLGVAYSYDVILDELLPHCKVPMYGVWSFYLGKGIVGGKITNAYDQGLMVSGMTKRVLAGTPTRDIPVVAGPTKYQFDYEVLNQHGISSYNLPAGSEIINRPYDFFFKNKLFFSLLLIIIFLLIVLVIVLYTRVRRVKQTLRTEQELGATIEMKSRELAEALVKAEQSNRLKESFISNISHEIRTPMNGILGFANLLSINDNPDSRNEYVEMIQHCGKQLMKIIDDILEISLIENKQVRITESVVNLKVLITDIHESLASSTKTRNKLVLSPPRSDDGNMIMVTDAMKLRQVLSNVLSNAIKFTSDGIIETSFTLDGGSVIFCVKDNGIGIDPRNHQVIFDKFRQLADDNNRMYGGNGLGLPIARAYVELLGGRMWVESSPGIGSSFFFSLPYKKEKTTQHVRKSTFDIDRINLKNKKILVAEDDEFNFMLLKKILEPLVEEIIHANTGQEALNFIASRTDIDLVIMDIRMPDLDGVSATKIIKTSKPSIPVIIQSAFATHSNVQNAFKAGCDEFISKPIDRNKLIYTVKKLLEELE